MVVMGLGIPACDDRAAAIPTAAGSSTALTTAQPLPTAPTTLSTAPALSEAQIALGHMTLRQKAAQVLLLTFDGATPTASTRALLAAGPPGGLLLLGENIGDMNRLSALTASLQETVAGMGAPGLFIAVDQEGGVVRRVSSGVPPLPSARALGDGSSPPVAKALALMTATGLLAQGVNMVLAPVADVVHDSDSFLYERTYGDRPGLVSEFVAAVTEGYENGGLIAVVKHFPGHGSADGDSHLASPVSRAGLVDFGLIHLPPFRAAIEAGAEGVMMGHFVAAAFDPSAPASLSKTVVGDVLRERLGFSGLVVTDDLEMGGATGSRPGRGERATPVQLGAAAVAALEAGCDLLVATGTTDRQRAILDAIVEAVATGRLAQQRLDDAVLRILAVKARHAIGTTAGL
jgi:beta-N-acetylhexosaminidase